MLQKRKFSHPFQSRSYNNVVVTKQIYFSSAFLKAWAHIPDNIVRVITGSQCNYVFTLKDLMGSEKKLN